MNELLEKALQIATDAHIYQVDKAGIAYIFHPIHVANRCSTDDERIVALLHDTIEDTEVTAEYLLMEGFPRNIVILFSLLPVIVICFQISIFEPLETTNASGQYSKLCCDLLSN